MSRVFDVLTAAVCEKNDLAKRELRGAVTEDALIAGFHPVLRSQSASTAGALPLDRLSTKETHDQQFPTAKKLLRTRINGKPPRFAPLQGSAGGGAACRRLLHHGLYGNAHR